MSENRHQMPGQWTKDARPRAHTHKLYNIPPLKAKERFLTMSKDNGNSQIPTSSTYTGTEPGGLVERAGPRRL